MQLHEKVEYYIKKGNPSEQFELLIEIMNSCDLAAIKYMQELYIDSYDNITGKILFKFRPAYCLLYWGEDGIDALIEGAKISSSATNNSIVFDILLYLVSDCINEVFPHYGMESRLREIVLKELKKHDIKDYAQSKLKEFLLSFEYQSDAIEQLGAKLHMSTFYSKRVIDYIITLLASLKLAVSTPVLEKYYEIIKYYPGDETKFHLFFIMYPQFLDPMALKVWSKPDLHGRWTPDFVVQRSDDSYLVVEIENPHKQILTRRNQLSASVSQAVRQVLDYKDYLNLKIDDAKKTFNNFSEPDCLVVIGLESTLSNEQCNILFSENRHRHKLRIVGFDYLARRVEAIRNNVFESPILIENERMQ
ncbi:MAG: DUF4263 domain-containing protein [Leptospiraceae bacterium]|nr:DUF4263 domain-containing protein [Leptospiraceae bacterium]